MDNTTALQAFERSLRRRFPDHSTKAYYHHDGNHNNNAAPNLVLLHAHCHDQEHGTRYP